MSAIYIEDHILLCYSQLQQIHYRCIGFFLFANKIPLFIDLFMYLFCDNGQPSECLGHEKFEDLAKKWKEAGARLIGGCCRTNPATIQAISSVLKPRT